MQINPNKKNACLVSYFHINNLPVTESMLLSNLNKI